jgi:hypothetical protein
MSYSQYERDQIRTYFGYPRLYISANSEFESAISTTQPYMWFGAGVPPQPRNPNLSYDPSQDGYGSAPDSSIENAIRNAIQKIDAIDGYIWQNDINYTNFAIYEVPASLSASVALKQDYRIVQYQLRKDGTAFIQAIANRIGVQPLRPYFYPDGIQPVGAMGRHKYNPGFFGPNR